MTFHSDPGQLIPEVRAFNRFYTQRVGALGKSHLSSDFSLTEVRVLYELAHRERPTARELAAALALDTGYLSRILQNFRRRGFLTSDISDCDARQQHLSLTEAGQRSFAALNAGADSEIEALLNPLSDKARSLLVGAMGQIQALLDPTLVPRVPYIIRPPRPGDYGWVVERHGAIYAREYGWDQRFEGLVAEIVAKFIAAYDSQREHCWIAEREGERVGCVFLVRQSDQVARLRLLLVEPSARSLGIGKQLVTECIQSARGAGYQSLTLWTNDNLHSARRIYQAAGFTLTREEPHNSFGKDLVGQTWELALH